jgi:hypothetical protein
MEKEIEIKLEVPNFDIAAKMAVEKGVDAFEDNEDSLDVYVSGISFIGLEVVVRESYGRDNVYVYKFRVYGQSR